MNPAMRPFGFGDGGVENRNHNPSTDVEEALLKVDIHRTCHVGMAHVIVEFAFDFDFECVFDFDFDFDIRFSFDLDFGLISMLFST